MTISRRGFFKLGGACALGLSAFPLVGALASGSNSNTDTSGKRYGMVVDMTKCNGCNECRVACHSIHNVPEMGDDKQDVKWIWTEEYDNIFPGMNNKYVDESSKKKPSPVLCNHCDNPACVRVCPTKATYKGKDGLVIMDFHRCIGCRFCMAACPYGARSFNFKDPRPSIKDLNSSFPTRRKGVVEKCNFCAERLAVGNLPICTEKCPQGALTFGDLNDPESEIRKVLSTQYTMQRKVELGTHPNIYYIV